MNEPTGTGASYRVGHMANDLKMQLKTIAGWIQKHAATVTYHLHDEPAQQLGFGFSQDAPDFLNLMSLAEAGEVNFVVIFSQNRLEIHPNEFQTVVTRLKDRNVAVWSASEDKCITPE
jgi:DNA invertase Pin-like site-specific DNA recombinase